MSHTPTTHPAAVAHGAAMSRTAARSHAAGLADTGTGAVATGGSAPVVGFLELDPVVAPALPIFKALGHLLIAVGTFLLGL